MEGRKRKKEEVLGEKDVNRQERKSLMIERERKTEKELEGKERKEKCGERIVTNV